MIYERIYQKLERLGGIALAHYFKQNGDLCHDPDDAAVLACARAAQTDLIISGDADLQTLGTYEGIPVLSPAQALQRVSM